MNAPSKWIVLLVLVATLVSPAVAADTALAYRLAAGDVFEAVTHTHVEAPVVGAVDTTISVKARVLAADAAGMRLEEEISSQSSHGGTFQMTMGSRLAPDGTISEIGGVDWNDSRQAFVAKTVASALPRLPDAPVTAGSTWQEEKPYNLPKAPIPGVPDVLRVTMTYTVTAVSGGQKPTVALAIVAQESPGQKARFEARGTATVDLATGKPLATHLEGKATLKVLFKSITVPITIDATGR